MRYLSVFYGHQFVSERFSAALTRDSIIRALESCTHGWNARRSSHRVSMQLTSDEPLNHDELMPQILKAINASPICIFNVSEMNSNVIFELGYSEGRSNQNIWICHESRTLSDFPADFRGRFLLVYNEQNLKAKLEAEMERRLERIFSIGTPERAFSELWNLDEFPKATIIAGSIPENEGTRYSKLDDRNFLKYQSFADIDSVVELTKFLMRNYELDVEEYSAASFSAPIDGPTIIVGGPGLNRIASRYFDHGVRGLSSFVPASFHVAQTEDADDTIFFGGKHYSPIDHKQGNITDVGLFARLLPSAGGAPVFLIAGCRTWGVLGAARCFMADSRRLDATQLGKRNAHVVLTQLGEGGCVPDQFIALFKVHVIDRVAQPVNLSDPRELIGLQRITWS